MSKKLILLSGPSCAGKTPLLRALPRVYPELRYGVVVLYSSRKPRPGEVEGVDFKFRDLAWIEALNSERFLVGRARTVVQALDLQEVIDLFKIHDTLVLEIYPSLGTAFQAHPGFRKLPALKLVSVFLSPMTHEEIAAIQEHMGYATPAEAAAAIMLPKLVARSQNQGKLITPAEAADLQIRAGRAWEEIEMGKTYDQILINHDGEDSHHWKYTPPLGEAGLTLRRFAEIISA